MNIYSNIDRDKYIKLQEEEAGEWEGGWADQMLSAFIEYVSSFPKDSRIIDIGCNTGRSLFELNKLEYTNNIGIDIVPSKIETAREKGLNVICLDMHDLSHFSDDEFDIAFMSHTIEHSIDPVLALSEMHRIAKNGFVICPIEDNKKELGTDPHFSSFISNEEWIQTFEESCKNKTYNLEVNHIPKQRLGREVWTFYKKLI